MKVEKYNVKWAYKLDSTLSETKNDVGVVCKKTEGANSKLSSN